MSLPLFERFAGGLIVSCQASPGEPMHGVDHMVAMAKAAVQGGARALRLNGPEEIRAIKRRVNLPVIGLYKQGQSGVYITPSFEAARQVMMAGADIIAVDGTRRRRPDGTTMAAQIGRIKADLAGKPVMADVATLDDGLEAVEAGADIVGTTLSGYTEDSRAQEGPDFDLLEALVARVSVPVILEGRVWYPQEAAHALKLGAYAVVVGSAITRPQVITERFAAAMERAGLEA